MENKNTMKRFAAHALLFNCDTFILRMIENCAPFVEKIYIAYSELPWNYNPQARGNFKNKTDKNILKRSPYFGKIELIEGEWKLDEEQRNACLDKARADGFDYLITQDADEYYLFDDYKKNIEEIKKNPDFDVYVAPWYSFWKTLDYVVMNDKNSCIVGYPEIAVNLKKEGIKFIRAREPNLKHKYALPGICYHLSYVLTDEEVYQKIHTWSHSHQFNRQQWYEKKWKKWYLGTRNLHPVYPPLWKKAAKFTGKLPEVLIDYKSPAYTEYFPRISDRLNNFFSQTLLTLFYKLKTVLIHLLKRNR